MSSSPGPNRGRRKKKNKKSNNNNKNNTNIQQSPSTGKHHHGTHASPSPQPKKQPSKQQQTTPNKQPKAKAADITVIVNRVDLWDSSRIPIEPRPVHNRPHTPIAPYSYCKQKAKSNNNKNVAVLRVPYNIPFNTQQPPQEQPQEAAAAAAAAAAVCTDASIMMDTSIANPYDPSIVHDKYWAQRRRLFHLFDYGIQLDAEGWFSTTPEIVAHHVAQRVAQQQQRQQQQGNHHPRVLLDAFCGCGGNAIAFGQQPSLDIIVAVDIDRNKLRMTAHNACIYQIPPHKLILIECNTIFVLQHCYRNGHFVLDQPHDDETTPFVLPPPVLSEVVAGFSIGGLELLPRTVDVIFMDPPWGGVNYELLGKNGYDLQKNMKIAKPVPPLEGVTDDFFDAFAAAPPETVQAKKAAFFSEDGEDACCVNGAELIQLAAAATRSKRVVYDLPRNTNRTSLGEAAYAAGYRGNFKLEEHYLNGRLKTVTAYLGGDYRSLMFPKRNKQHHGKQSKKEAAHTDDEAVSSCDNLEEQILQTEELQLPEQQDEDAAKSGM